MKTYILSAQERGGEIARVPLRRAKETKVNAILAAVKFSERATLCDVVLTCGSKHVATYRNGRITALNGKDRKA